ncbi:Pigment protein [Candidatus Phaeomarinobacter ectocarpi]|uniref:Pigment protein n=1 Tax=Candidatus Phaeomarinibacter ectocarpi TaxID=1458461 RepID=X5MF45_9HYPH|nr:acyl-CoA dehydrogenase family protein [Candidatus Phaeomarinobacter ectocarpi]CDO59609.1 Pigment protein [Candidatus Phaeomarinobacter ectocarpi]
MPSDTAQMVDHPTGGDGLIAAAHAFAGELRERAAEIESGRQLPQDIADRFAAAGFYRMAVPKALGGLEATPQQIAGVIDALAQADGSAAWCVMIGSTTGLTAAYLDPAAATRIYGDDPNTITAGVFAPMGTADMSTDSATVKGRWAWGSGSHNAQWVFGGARLMSDGAPVMDDAGRPRTQMFAMPVQDLKLHDNWDPSGLAGSGSSDFEANDVVVPLGHGADITRPPGLTNPLYAFPVFGLLAVGIASVATGLARQAIDEIIEIGGGKVPQGSRKTLAHRPQAQSELAQGEAELRAAHAFLENAVGAAWDAAAADGSIGVDHRRDLRLAATHATTASARVVDRMYLLGGGSSVHRTSPLQRAFRDVHVATQHMMTAPATWELTGRLLFGLETDTATL